MAGRGWILWPSWFSKRCATIHFPAISSFSEPNGPTASRLSSGTEAACGFIKSNWVGKVCFLLGPIYHYILADILGSPVIFGDETTLPVLDPGRGKTKTGYLRAHARDERPWQGDRPPAVAYIYEEDRRHQHAVDHLVGFKGILHCDGYAAYDKGLKKRLEAEDDGIRLAQCNVHARRNFYDVHKATDSPIAAEALRRYAELYPIEADIRGCPADIRLHVRQERSRPLMDDFEA
jgi:transposase